MVFQKMIKEEVIGRFVMKGVDVSCCGIEEMVVALGIAAGHGARAYVWNVASSKLRARASAAKSLGFGMIE